MKYEIDEATLSQLLTGCQLLLHGYRSYIPRSTGERIEVAYERASAIFLGFDPDTKKRIEPGSTEKKERKIWQP